MAWNAQEKKNHCWELVIAHVKRGDAEQFLNSKSLEDLFNHLYDIVERFDVEIPG